MIRFKKVKIYLLLIVLVSCNPKQDYKKEARVVHNSGDFKTINILDTSIQGINISQFGKELEYIPLESPINSLVGEVEKLLYCNNKFFVLDTKIANSLFVFDISGKLLYKKKVSLGGPGQFKSIRDFAIDKQNGWLYVYSDGERKIFKYSLENGAFLSTLKLKDGVFDNLYVDNPNKFLLTRDGKSSYKSSDYGEFRVCQVDSTGKLERGWLEYPVLQSVNFDKAITTLTGDQSRDIIIRRPLKDTIYAFKNDSLQALYKIDFGEASRKLQNDIFFSRDANSLAAMLFHPNMTYLTGRFFDTKKYLCFNFFKGNSGQVFLLDRIINKHFISRSINNDIDNIPLRNIEYWDDQFLMCIIDPRMVMKQYEYLSKTDSFENKYPKLTRLYGNITKDANPILGIIRF
jgi:hypothetical protein